MQDQECPCRVCGPCVSSGRRRDRTWTYANKLEERGQKRKDRLRTPLEGVREGGEGRGSLEQQIAVDEAVKKGNGPPGTHGERKPRGTCEKQTRARTGGAAKAKQSKHERHGHGRTRQRQVERSLQKRREAATAQMWRSRAVKQAGAGKKGRGKGEQKGPAQTARGQKAEKGRWQDAVRERKGRRMRAKAEETEQDGEQQKGEAEKEGLEETRGQSPTDGEKERQAQGVATSREKELKRTATRKRRWTE